MSLLLLLFLLTFSSSYALHLDGHRIQRIEVPELAQKLGKEVFYYEVCDHAYWELDHEAKDKNGEEFSFGAKLWPASLGLAKVLIDRQTELRSSSIKTVLEVGAGVGLSSLVAATIFDEDKVNVLCSDLSPLTLKLVTKAAEDMGITSIESQVFDVMGPDALPQADLVLFADVLYSSSLGRGVARRVHEAAMRGSGVILSSMRERNGRTAFLDELKILGRSETFPSYRDGRDIEVQFNAVKWKRKVVELLEINLEQFSIN